MRNANVRLIVVTAVLVAGLANFSCSTHKSKDPRRPASTVPTRTSEQVLAHRPAWAEAIDKPGLPNLARVSDTLYRGAQPTREGMRQLHAMGIKTVVNLRAAHSDDDEVGDLPLSREHIRMTVMRITDDDVVEFLAIATDPSRAPVFVHCQQGLDRTGVMCAMYRVAVCGWTKDQAIDEMKEGGFGFHRALRHLVKFIVKADIDDIKRRAGVGE